MVQKLSRSGSYSLDAITRSTKVKMIKTISLIIGIIIGLATIGGLIIADRNNFARAASVKKINEEILLMREQYTVQFAQIQQQGIDNHKRATARDLDDRIWTIEQRFFNQPMDQTTKETLRDLRLELEQLRREGY